MSSAASSSGIASSGRCTSSVNRSVACTVATVHARPRTGRAEGARLHSVDVTTDLREAASTRLRRANQRVTANRVALVELLAEAPRPLTIPEILTTRDGLAQSSVYRNLVVLEQAGVVHRIVTNDEFARFELAEDLTGDH